jgi:hypothetical protein
MNEDTKSRYEEWEEPTDRARDNNSYLQEIAQNTSIIAAWVRFFGVAAIFILIVSLINLFLGRY